MLSIYGILYGLCLDSISVTLLVHGIQFDFKAKECVDARSDDCDILCFICNTLGATTSCSEARTVGGVRVYSVLSCRRVSVAKALTAALSACPSLS